jgi:hypothetical protein
LGILTVGFIYEWQKGALDWSTSTAITRPDEWRVRATSKGGLPELSPIDVSIFLEKAALTKPNKRDCKKTTQAPTTNHNRSNFTTPTDIFGVSPPPHPKTQHSRVVVDPDSEESFDDEAGVGELYALIGEVLAD